MISPMRFFLFMIILFSGCVSSNANFNGPNTKDTTNATVVDLVEIANYTFEADSFFDERKNISFTELPVDPKFVQWANYAIESVNRLIPREDQVPNVKLKLIFQADIHTHGRTLSRVPISIIESYQEPKTNSIRLGMLELKDSQLSFEQTVAHEYTHLVFENASRKAGTTSHESDHIEFWPKSAYEGMADMMASMALNTPFTGEPGSWATRDLNEFKTLTDAREAKDSTAPRAKKAFRQMGIIPKYRIYQDWLSKVDQFFKASGGTDPYAEGTWFAGALLKSANTQEKRNKLIKLLIDSAKTGKAPKDLDSFYQDLIGNLE